MQQAECTRNCWITGAIAGLVVMLFASGIGDTDWLGGLFLGLLTWVLLGGLLVLLVAQGQPAPYDDGLRVGRQIAPATTLSTAISTQGAAVPVTPEPQPQNVDPVASAHVEPVAAPQSAPSGASKQDLKRITGIGPKIEEALNDLGVARFDQIAGWNAQDEQDMAAKLGRLGSRIGTDNWVAQARELAAADDAAAGDAMRGGGNG